MNVKQVYEKMLNNYNFNYKIENKISINTTTYLLEWLKLFKVTQYLMLAYQMEEYQVEEIELLYTASGNVKCYNYFGT